MKMAFALFLFCVACGHSRAQDFSDAPTNKFFATERLAVDCLPPQSTEGSAEVPHFVSDDFDVFPFSANTKTPSSNFDIILSAAEEKQQTRSFEYPAVPTALDELDESQRYPCGCTKYGYWKILPYLGWNPLEIYSNSRIITTDETKHVVVVKMVQEEYEFTLLDMQGKILDRISCKLDFQYGQVDPQFLDTPDFGGSQLVLAYNETKSRRWNPVPPNSYTINFHDKSYTYHDQHDLTWAAMGICRVAIKDEQFQVRFPQLTEGRK